MILLEGSKAMPIIRAILSTQDHPIFIAINIYKEMSNSIAQLYASQIVPPSSKAKAVGINISIYDTLISRFLIRLRSSILRKLIEPDEPDSADKSVWDPIIDYFSNTPVVLPNGIFMKIKGSLPSGSYFTEFIDSAVNYATSNYVQLRVFGKSYPIYVLGEDSIFRVPQETEVDLIVMDYKKQGDFVDL